MLPFCVSPVRASDFVQLFHVFFFCQFRVSFMRLHFPIYAHSLGQLAYYTFHADLREGNLSYPRMSGLGGRLFLYKYVDVMGVT